MVCASFHVSSACERYSAADFSGMAGRSSAERMQRTRADISTKAARWLSEQGADKSFLQSGWAARDCAGAVRFASRTACKLSGARRPSVLGIRGAVFN